MTDARGRLARPMGESPRSERWGEARQPHFGASTRFATLGALVAAALAVVLFVSLDLTSMVGDDGGITLRYAERLSRGLGFSYNDGELVNGASNPLAVFALSALMRAGFAPARVVMGIAGASLALATGLLCFTLLRFYSWPAALFGVVALLLQPSRLAHIVSGLESPLTVLLVCALFLACKTRSVWFQGVCLGLLVANKLDGVFAVLAFVGAQMISGSAREPTPGSRFWSGPSGYLVAPAATSVKRIWRRRQYVTSVALVAALTTAPLFVFLLVRFRSIVPTSAITKVTLHSSPFFDRKWFLTGLYRENQDGLVLYLAACAIVWVVFRRFESTAATTMMLWLVLHSSAYSLVDLGGRFAWYLVPSSVLLVVLASIALHLTSELVGKRLRWARPFWAVAFSVWLLISFAPVASRLIAPPPGWLPSWAERDLARQAAGAWLRKNTSGRETLVSPWGLPALEYEGPVYDTTLLNSDEDHQRGAEAHYFLAEVAPGVGALPEQRRGDLVAFFRYGQKSAGYAVYARSHSEVALRLLRGEPLVPVRSSDFKVIFPRGRERVDRDRNDASAR